MITRHAVFPQALLSMQRVKTAPTQAPQPRARRNMLKLSMNVLRLASSTFGIRLKMSKYGAKMKLDAKVPTRKVWVRSRAVGGGSCVSDCMVSLRRDSGRPCTSTALYLNYRVRLLLTGAAGGDWA
mmetsp:Transcript_1957/g.5531  ORF Transcript_1957/g.5531 Transcript_1957/m.5531 type:complete len:126 (-) Transcript_1957:14-391(-)